MAANVVAAVEAVQAVVDALEADHDIEEALLRRPCTGREAAATALLGLVDSDVLAKKRDETAVARYALATCALRLVATVDVDGRGAVLQRALDEVCASARLAQKWGHALEPLAELRRRDARAKEPALEQRLDALTSTLRRELVEHLRESKLLKPDLEADAASKGPDMPAYYLRGVAKDGAPLRHAIEREGVSGGADAYTLRRVLRKDSAFDRPAARANAETIAKLYSRGPTLDDALLALGVRLGTVVARVGSWNVRASLNTHKIDEHVGSKAARVRACAAAEHWDAFALQEAPPSSRQMAALVDALARELDAASGDASWAFQTAQTHVAADKDAGDGVVFGYRTARWAPACAQPIPFLDAQFGPRVFRRAPVAMLLRAVRAGGGGAAAADGRAGDGGDVLALVSVHLTSRAPGGDRGADGLARTRDEVGLLGGEAFVAWLRDLRAEHSARARSFACLLLGDFNLGRPETHDALTDPLGAWDGLLRSGFRFADDASAPGDSNLAEFAVGDADGAGHPYDNALLLARLEPCDGGGGAAGGAGWLAERPRCAVVALPPDVRWLADRLADACAAAAATRADRHASEAERAGAALGELALVKSLQALVYASFSDHKPLTVSLLLAAATSRPSLVAVDGAGARPAAAAAAAAWPTPPPMTTVIDGGPPPPDAACCSGKCCAVQ